MLKPNGSINFDCHKQHNFIPAEFEEIHELVLAKEFLGQNNWHLLQVQSKLGSVFYQVKRSTDELQLNLENSLTLHPYHKSKCGTYYHHPADCYIP